MPGQPDGWQPTGWDADENSSIEGGDWQPPGWQPPDDGSGGSSNTVSCQSISQPAVSGCTVFQVATVVRVKPAPRVQHRQYDFEQLVNAAERAAGGSAGPSHYPVYSFGSGRNRRIFTEKV